jgi:hypothetical protein
MRHRTLSAAVIAASLILEASAARAGAITACGAIFPNICGGTLVTGGVNVPPPNDVMTATAGPNGAFFESAGGGSMSLFGVGTGGISANAAGSGGMGEVHLSTFADNGQFNTPQFFNQGIVGHTFAESEIKFLDSAVAPGPVGAPVTIVMTLTVDGAFGGDGQVSTDLAFSDPGVVSFVQSDLLANSIRPSFAITDTFNVSGGDRLFWSMDMLAEAGTTNDSALLLNSFADVSHTGRLFFDLPSGAGLIGLTGHDYASVLPAGGGAIPEPESWAMMLVGLLGLGAVRHNARRNRAGAAAST